MNGMAAISKCYNLESLLTSIFRAPILTIPLWMQRLSESAHT